MRYLVHHELVEGLEAALRVHLEDLGEEGLVRLLVPRLVAGDLAADQRQVLVACGSGEGERGG